MIDRIEPTKRFLSIAAPITYEPGLRMEIDAWTTYTASNQTLFSKSGQRVSDYVSPGIQRSDTGIGFINGIGNTIEYAMSHADYIHALAQGYSVELFYSETDGMLADLQDAVLGNIASSKEIDQLKEAWRLFDEANAKSPGAKYLQICHSQGGAYVKRALEESPQAIRDRVIVVNIAVAVIVPNELCFQSYNYASENDYINWVEMARNFDPNLTMGLKQWAQMNKHREEIIWMQGSCGPWWVPAFLYQLYSMHHEFQDPIFEDIIAGHIANYLNSSGYYS